MTKYKELRLKCNLTVKEAAIKLEITEATLRLIEQGKQKAGIKLKYRMCEVYKTSLLELGD